MKVNERVCQVVHPGKTNRRRAVGYMGRGHTYTDYAWDGTVIVRLFVHRCLFTWCAFTYFTVVSAFPGPFTAASNSMWLTLA